MSGFANRPLSILLVGDYPADPRLGSPKVLFKLRDEFSALGHSARVLSREDLGGPHQRHVRDLAAPWLAARAATRLAAAGYRPDVVDASSAEGYVLAARARSGGTAVVARSHGLEHLNYRCMLADADAGLAPRAWYRRLWYPAVRMRLVAAAARAADRLIVLNETDRAFAVEHEWKAPEQVDVVPHGLAACFFDAPAPAAGRRDLLFCGSWARVKGVDYLARAFGAALRDRPATTLTVLGPGVPIEDVLRTFDPPARPHVRVVDRLDERGVLQEYRTHRALVMCSTFEGFGMVVPEAMSQRMAVIATPVGAAASFVRDGETGVIVPPRDAVALAAAIRRVLDDVTFGLRLGDAAAAAVAGMSWTETARRTLAVYRRALESRRHTDGARAA